MIMGKSPNLSEFLPPPLKMGVRMIMHAAARSTGVMGMKRFINSAVLYEHYFLLVLSKPFQGTGRLLKLG